MVGASGGNPRRLFLFPSIFQRPLKNLSHGKQAKSDRIILLRSFPIVLSAREPSGPCRRPDVYRRTCRQRCRRAGRTHVEAEEAAREDLFHGLHFSPYNTLVNVLWNEFAAEIPEKSARRVALLLLPLCREVLVKYDFSDDFAATPAYDLFYTELTGTVQILLEDGI